MLTAADINLCFPEEHRLHKANKTSLRVGYAPLPCGVLLDGEGG